MMTIQSQFDNFKPVFNLEIPGRSVLEFQYWKCGQDLGIPWFLGSWDAVPGYRVSWETERLFVVTKFYENMLQMKMQLERTYFDLAAMSESDCLIICDGGTMDIKARTYCRISWHGRQYLTSLS